MASARPGASGFWNSKYVCHQPSVTLCVDVQTELCIGRKSQPCPELAGSREAVAPWLLQGTGPAHLRTRVSKWLRSIVTGSLQESIAAKDEQPARQIVKRGLEWWRLTHSAKRQVLFYREGGAHVGAGLWQARGCTALLQVKFSACSTQSAGWWGCRSSKLQFLAAQAVTLRMRHTTADH